MKKLLALLIILISFSACSKEDDGNPISPPTDEGSFVDGEWKGIKSEESWSFSVEFNIDEINNAISGTGTSKYTVSDEFNNINETISGSLTGRLAGSSISITLMRMADSSYVDFNGQLNKNDSTKFVGNAIIFLKDKDFTQTIRSILIQKQ